MSLSHFIYYVHILFNKHVDSILVYYSSTLLCYDYYSEVRGLSICTNLQASLIFPGSLSGS